MKRNNKKQIHYITFKTKKEEFTKLIRGLTQ